MIDYFMQTSQGKIIVKPVYLDDFSKASICPKESILTLNFQIDSDILGLSIEQTTLKVEKVEQESNEI